MPNGTPTLDQSAEDLGLKWTCGNDLNFMWWVEDVDWSGPYVAKVLERPAGRPVMEFEVTATYDATSVPPRTNFAMVGVDSTPVRGNGWWVLIDETLNLTRFSGPVTVVT